MLVLGRALQDGFEEVAKLLLFLWITWVSLQSSFEHVVSVLVLCWDV